MRFFKQLILLAFLPVVGVFGEQIVFKTVATLTPTDFNMGANADEAESDDETLLSGLAHALGDLANPESATGNMVLSFDVTNFPVVQACICEIGFELKAEGDESRYVRAESNIPFAQQASDIEQYLGAITSVMGIPIMSLSSLREQLAEGPVSHEGQIMVPGPADDYYMADFTVEVTLG